MTEAITHWTQFHKLYNLDDPRPYFRGVETGGYRMPGVMAGLISHLMPVLAAREGRAADCPIRMLDFACGYGTVGMCLRHTLSMGQVYDYFAGQGDTAADRAYFQARQRPGLPAHHIDGVDIADVALRYATSVGALDAGYAGNVLEGPLPESIAKAAEQADLIYECGAIGELISPAMAALLDAANQGPAHQARPWVLLCPRPRVAIATLQAVLADQGYRLATVVSGVRYRRPFSEEELAEEIAAGVFNGLSEEDCTVDDYFRVDIRLAVPVDDSPPIAETGLADFNADAYWAK